MLIKRLGRGGQGDIFIYHSRLNARLNAEWYGMAKNVSEDLVNLIQHVFIAVRRENSPTGVDWPLGI